MMNKRLVWNFEINSDNLLELPMMDGVAEQELRWEARYFWPEDNIIILHGLNHGFLALSAYKIKHKQDSYYLLPDADYNIKMREEHLYYKPLLVNSPHAQAFGKKIKLEECAASMALPGLDTPTAKVLLGRIKNQGRKISIEKEALIYRFASNPQIKLELARIQVANRVYFTLSIESRALAAVELVSRHVLGDTPACDYVRFLKTITGIPSKS